MKIQKDSEIICKNCGEVSNAIIKTKGSIIIEIFLYLFYIIPGVLYTLYRVTNKYPICQHCESKEIILRNKRVGESLYKKLYNCK